MSAVLHVDLDAFAANLAEIRRRVAPAEHMLVVKDDAYAHGLAPIVRRAAAEGVRWFGAFDVLTGAAVRRELGDGVRIFVWLVADAADAAAALRHDLDVGVGDTALLEDVATAAREAGRAARVHLKIDSGLRRNGVRPEEWPAFVARAVALQDAGEIVVEGVWSHIAEASDAEDDDARAVYDRAVAQARDAGLRPALRHLAASAAAFARPEFRYDLVRIGAFAYGIRSAGGPDEAELSIRPISRLTTEVQAVDGRTATIGVGAWDGLPSTLAGVVSVGTPQGPRPVTAIGGDTSTIDGDGLSVGDVVTVYGDGAASATTLAEAIGTIGEEIALRISPRVHRRYDV